MPKTAMARGQKPAEPSIAIVPWRPILGDRENSRVFPEYLQGTQAQRPVLRGGEGAWLAHRQQGHTWALTAERDRPDSRPRAPAYREERQDERDSRRRVIVTYGRAKGSL